MGLDWSIIRENGPIDFAGNFARGYQIADKIISGVREKQALGELAHAPDDRNALAKLYGANPQLGQHFEAMNARRQAVALAAQQRERQAALGARYTQDPQGARQEALASGDFDLAKTFGDMDKETAERTAKLWTDGIAPVAFRLSQMPEPEKRAALWKEARPLLEGRGADPRQLDRFDPQNNDQIAAALATGQSIKDLVDQSKITWHQQGEQPSFATDALGRPVGSANPYAQGGTPAAPVAANGAQGEVASALSDAGLPQNVVAGFMGNFHAEGGYGGAAGDGGTAFGIAQWRGDRVANFERVVGKPIAQATPTEQAKFVLWEMQNPEAAGMSVQQRDAILAAKSPGEAAELIDRFYERSSGQHRQTRIDAANRFLGSSAGPAIDTGRKPAAILQAEAAAAIAAGADPGRVNARLREMMGGR